MTQMDYANTKGQYTYPTLWLGWSKKQWGWLTSDMSPAQLKDFEESKTILEKYEKLYSLMEYTTTLNENMMLLERKMMTNNSTIPMNFYRACSANSQKNLFPQVEAYLQAYYDLIDDCEQYPNWKRKIQEDLGGVVSFMAIQMEEVARDELVATSPAFARFDADK